MKKWYILVQLIAVILFMSARSLVFAQTDLFSLTEGNSNIIPAHLNGLPVPAYEYSVVGYSNSTKTTIDLEAIMVDVGSKNHLGFKMFGSQKYMRVAGKTSIVIVREGQPYFILRMGPDDVEIEPRKWVTLHRMDIIKGSRRVVLSSGNWKGEEKSEGYAKQILLKIQRLDPEYPVFLVQPITFLEEGEYAFLVDEPTEYSSKGEKIMDSSSSMIYAFSRR